MVNYLRRSWAVVNLDNVAHNIREVRKKQEKLFFFFFQQQNGRKTPHTAIAVVSRRA